MNGDAAGPAPPRWDNSCTGILPGPPAALVRAAAHLGECNIGSTRGGGITQRWQAHPSCPTNPRIMNSGNTLGKVALQAPAANRTVTASPPGQGDIRAANGACARSAAMPCGSDDAPAIRNRAVPADMPAHWSCGEKCGLDPAIAHHPCRGYNGKVVP